LVKSLTQLKGLDSAMNATAVVTFPNSDQAFDALKALEASSGSMVYGSVVATKDLNGNLFLNEPRRTRLAVQSAAHSSVGSPVCPLAQLR